MSRPSIESALVDSWRYNLDHYAARVSGGKWIPYAWHRYLGDVVTDAIVQGNARLIISAPPRHGKSELVSRWLSTWYLDTFPDRRVILGSYAVPLATDWSRKIRDTFASSELTWAKLNPAHAQNHDWRLKEGGGLRAVGVAGSITGFGGDLVLVDDPHKDWAEAQSPRYRKRVVDWFTGTLYHRLEPDASIIVIMTRWHSEDLAGWLMDEHDDNWTNVCLPAIAGESDPMGRKQGEPLCAERYTAERLRKIEKAITPRVFAGLFQQSPIPEKGEMVDANWFRYYDDAPSTFDEVIQSWDLSQDEGDEASFVVGQVWGRVGADIYLIDQFRKQINFPDTIRSFAAMSLRHPKARRKLVEKKANGAPLRSTLQSKIPGIVMVNPQGSKIARLAAVLPVIESGNVYLPNPERRSWVYGYVEELVQFPRGKHDDQVDATSQALSSLSETALAKLRALATL